MDTWSFFTFFLKLEIALLWAHNSCKHNDHIGFFVFCEVCLQYFHKIKKNPCDHNGGRSYGRSKTLQNEFFLDFRALFLSGGIFDDINFTFIKRPSIVDIIFSNLNIWKQGVWALEELKVTENSFWSHFASLFRLPTSILEKGENWLREYTMDTFRNNRKTYVIC